MYYWRVIRSQHAAWCCLGLPGIPVSNARSQLAHRRRGQTYRSAGEDDGCVDKQSLLAVLRQELFSPASTAEELWDLGLVSRLLADGSLGARTTGLLALIETPEAMEGYVLRAQGQDDAKRRAQRCITALQEASRLAAGRGWLPDTARAGARRAGTPVQALL